MSSPYDKLKEGIRWMWSLGDYSRLAVVLEPHAEALADACAIQPGVRVLDVAAGNGNFALAVARRRALVTASDLSPRMVELGRERSAAAGLEVEWTDADAEALPFANSSYDVVASVFGAMFAPRPELVSSEMFRVAMPGGLVAMANYSPSGFLGGVSDLIASFSTRPALPLPSPFLWGEEHEVRERFRTLAASIDVFHSRLSFESDSVESLLAFWEETNPPQNALKAMLPPEAYRKLIEGWASLVDDLNEGAGGRVKVSSPYILVLARKSVEDVLSSTPAAE